jgi:hypothetical protein
MASSANIKRLRFEQKAKRKGYRVVRTRPAYTSGGVVTPAQTAIYNALDDPERSAQIRQAILVGAGDNLKNDSFKPLLFPYNADVQEGDELTLSNIRWIYQVTAADDPLQIESTVIYLQVMAVRKAK